MLQTNKDKRKSREKAKRERLAAEKEARRSAVLTEWERTCSPPQSEQVLLTFV